MKTSTTKNSYTGTASGFALVVYLALLIPLIGLVGAAMMAMGARSKGLQNEIAEEKALLAAESGIDEARYRGATNALVDGAPFTRSLSNKASFSVEPTHLLVDGEDNNGDAVIDDADEDVFRVIATGTYGRTTRRIAAYLERPATSLPQAAIFTEDAAWDPVLPGTSFVSGIDMNLDGTPGPDPAVPGIALGPGISTATISGNLSATEQPKVTGLGGAPSVGNTAEQIDVESLANKLWNSSPQIGFGGSLGDASTGDYRLVYWTGEVELESDTSGAGILVIEAEELELEATLHWDGIVIVLGGEELEAEGGNLEVNGMLLMGPDSWEEWEFEDSGALQVQYSSEIVTAVQSALLTDALYVTQSGWQEIARR